MRIARVIGIALFALSGASLSGCVLGVGMNGGGPPMAIGRGGSRTVVEGGHSHVICHGDQIWLQNYGVGYEVPDGKPFLAESQPPRGCGQDRLMHPVGPEHEAGYRAWLEKLK